MATKLPPPPTHMKPGSPAFTEWFRTLADYIGKLAGRPNFAMSSVILPDSYCCIPVNEQTICQIKVEERDGDIISVAFYAGSWQEPVGDYDYYLKLKRNNKTVKVLRGGFGRSGWDGNDRNVHSIYYKAVDADADAIWKVTLQLDSVTGAFPTLNGAGLVIQVR